MPLGGPARVRQVVRFGVFELNLKAGELRREGLKVRLQQQPFQILRLLLERPGELVTHAEIIRLLWPNGTIVEYEHSVKTAVKKIRHALSDDADAPRYVENLPRRGYRFIYPVDDLGAGPVPAGSGGVGAGLPTAPGQVAPLSLGAAQDIPTRAPQEPALSGAKGVPLQVSAANLIGKKVSHYRVLEILGGGGMARRKISD